MPPRNIICKDIFLKQGQQREKSAFQTELHSCHQYEFRVSKHFLFPWHTICLNSSSSFYRSPNGSNLPEVPQRRPQISSLGSNGLPRRLLTFIILLKYQIQTPGWVHQLSSCLLACSFRAGSALGAFLCVFPKALHNKQRERRRWPAMLRNVLYGGFPRCLMGISCSSMSSAGRASLWLLRRASVAILLCILSVRDVCKMGPLSTLFSFSMGRCLSKLSLPTPRKEIPQNFF